MIGLIIFALLLMTSCGQNNQITIKTKMKSFEPGPTVQHPIGNSKGFKVTPGAARLIGTNSGAEAKVLVDERMLTGSRSAMRFSISNLNQYS